ncbi:glycosyltransferase family 8 protein [Lacticaseibacillus mingshuiensis]|uniref:Glycosyltransferase family 8 protein n=1 Tax=Lacticaseibacillus mingshuiensis TaxID=2799574 RepID=A0ABW4CKU1_9LACO|nr:glycosyltransferase [Lacticaseibacillus mingshuiensis]
MNILYCGDASMAPGVLLSVMSLVAHTAEKLQVFLLTAQLKTADRSYAPLAAADAAFIDRWLQAARPGSRVMRLDITTQFLREPPTANMATRFTPYCMLRLYADQISALPDRLLYLDTDVIAAADPSDFYHQDLASAEVVGVLDHYGKWAFHTRLGFDYLNSGVLLMDLAALRESGLLAACRRRCAKVKMFMPDQSALNKLAGPKKRVAKRRYNDQHGPHADTVLLHFSTRLKFLPKFTPISVKPWEVAKVHDQLNYHAQDALLADFETTLAQMKGQTHD